MKGLTSQTKRLAPYNFKLQQQYRAVNSRSCANHRAPIKSGGFRVKCMNGCEEDGARKPF